MIFTHLLVLNNRQIILTAVAWEEPVSRTCGDGDCSIYCHYSNQMLREHWPEYYGAIKALQNFKFKLPMLDVPYAGIQDAEHRW